MISLCVRAMRKGVLLLLGLAVCSPAFADPGKTLFCLADGTQISADRFETKDGKFLLYVAGSAAPLEYPVANVKGINVDHCATPPSPVPTPSPTVAQFGIYGSNTIGERLMPMLIDAYGSKRLGTQPESQPGQPEEQRITLRQGKEARAVIDFQAHGSGTAAKGLVEGKALIGMASRRLKPEEAQSIGVSFNVDPLAPGNEHVLALDGLAVIVNQDNPVKSLSLEQIAAIFSGTIQYWSDVGGQNQPIVVHRRDDKSGTFDTFKNLVLEPAKLTISAQATKHESSDELSSAVANDPNAIGFIGLPYINKNHPLSITSTCGLASGPSRYAVKTETYPLARRLYLYTVGAPADFVARDLLQFALSDEAQSTISEAGFVDQAIDFQDAADQKSWSDNLIQNPGEGLPEGSPVPRQMVDAFSGIIGNVRRASIVFRFESGSAQLDTRALQDIGRLARYLSSPEMSGKPFWITGFADPDGGWQYNKMLAGQRAAAVGVQLQNAGVRISQQNILTASYMAPVACNDSDAGKAKNRRVEVWIGK